MTDAITHQDLVDLGDRIERKIDQRFDAFETHFDDTMSAIRVTLGEIDDQMSAENQRRYAKIETALIELARQTGHFEDVAVLLRS